MKTVHAAFVPAESVKLFPAVFAGDDALKEPSVVAVSRPDEAASEWKTSNKTQTFSTGAWAFTQILKLLPKTKASTKQSPPSRATVNIRDAG